MSSAPSHNPARRSSRPSRRLTIGLVIAAVVVGLVIIADFVLGVVIQGRASCQTTNGVDVRVDSARFPVTSGIFTGSIGTADAFIPWSVVEQTAQENAPDGVRLALTGREGFIVAEVSSGLLPVIAILRPGIDDAGQLDVSVVGLSIAGREVPPELAEGLGGFGGLLHSGSLLGGLGQDLPFEVTSIDVRDDGIELEARLPLSAMGSSGGGSECGVSAS